MERGWRGPAARPPRRLRSPPFGYCHAFPGIFFFFFFFASLELNDISSSAGAAGRLEIAQRERLGKAAKGSSRLCGKGEGVLLGNPFFSRKNPLGLSLSPALGLWHCRGWGEGEANSAACADEKFGKRGLGDGDVPAVSRYGAARSRSSLLLIPLGKIRGQLLEH